MDKEEFLKFITRYEGKKRVDSFFTELFFSKQAEFFFGSDNIAFNWLYTDYPFSKEEVKKRPRTNHIFFKLLTPGNHAFLNSADISLIKKLQKNTTDRIVIIDCTNKNNWTAKRVEKISSEDRVVHFDKLPSKADDFFKTITKKINDRIGQPAPEPKSCNPASNGSSCSEYVELLYDTLDESQRTELITGRQFIYKLFYTWFHQQPVDIDAVVCIKNEPVIIEYKRKYPSTGRNVHKTNIANDLTKLIDLEDGIKQALKNSGKRYAGLDFMKAQYFKHNYDYEYTPSFGLDIIPHSSFLRCCSKNKIRYFHMIWNHKVEWENPNDTPEKAERKKKTRSYYQIDFENNCFSKPQPVSGMYIEPSLLYGITHTLGDDSGRDNGLRLQETIPADKFNPFERYHTLNQVLETIKSDFVDSLHN